MYYWKDRLYRCCCALLVGNPPLYRQTSCTISEILNTITRTDSCLLKKYSVWRTVSWKGHNYVRSRPITMHNIDNAIGTGRSVVLWWEWNGEAFSLHGAVLVLINEPLCHTHLSPLPVLWNAAARSSCGQHDPRKLISIQFGDSSRVPLFSCTPSSPH